LFQSMIYLTMIGGLAAVYAIGVGNVGALGAVLLIMVRAGTYGQQIQSAHQGIIQSLPFVERIRTATEGYEANRRVSEDRPLDEVTSLSFAGVSYSYRDGRPVLSDITFHTTRGDAIGIVGPSGAGKSTLVQILLRLRDPNRGTYLINGLPAELF